MKKSTSSSPKRNFSLMELVLPWIKKQDEVFFDELNGRFPFLGCMASDIERDRINTYFWVWFERFILCHYGLKCKFLRNKYGHVVSIVISTDMNTIKSFKISTAGDIDKFQRTVQDLDKRLEELHVIMDGIQKDIKILSSKKSPRSSVELLSMGLNNCGDMVRVFRNKTLKSIKRDRFSMLP